MKIDDTTCFINCTRNNSQLPTMSENSTLIVYQRRKHLKNSVDVSSLQPSDGTKHVDACISAISFEEPMNIDMKRTAKACNANENCSSSKSNLGLSTSMMRIDSNAAAECSSSGDPPKIAEREISIVILRNQELLDEFKIKTRKNGASTERNGVMRKKKYCSKSCKVCKHIDSTSNMLICDNCEDAFHRTCCSPRITILPVEWLCGSCLKKKHKMLRDNSTSNVAETGKESDLGSLEFMIKDPEPYMSNVRIGSDFQADVPDWCGPVNEECDLAGDPIDTYPSNNLQKRDSTSMEPLKLSSIGNWLQCREVIETGEGGHEKRCEKWRRAPLYEVQTDNWECFCSVLWDPVHADCAVPQELPTEEVLKQLKYVEMLRPRLAAKRRRLNTSKSNGSRDSEKRGDTLSCNIQKQ